VEEGTSVGSEKGNRRLEAGKRQDQSSYRSVGRNEPDAGAGESERRHSAPAGNESDEARKSYSGG
jgi:hypothetical protein